MFYIILFSDIELLSIFRFLLKIHIRMGIWTQIRTEPAMIRTKSKPKFVNIQIRFKFLTLKIQNPNRLTESEHIYEWQSLEKAIQQIL